MEHALIIRKFDLLTSSHTSTLPRSNYARKLLDFPDLVFTDNAAFQFSGKWSDLFRNRIGPSYDSRVICEIGCSDATFLRRIAAKYPNSGFVGLDWKCKPIYDGTRHIAASGIKNLVLLRGRGQDIAHYFGRQEVDEIWIFHPDPCSSRGMGGPPMSSHSGNTGGPPVPRALENRLIGEPFLLDAHAILRNNASLLAIKTDHPGYYQSMLGLLGLPEPAWFQIARDCGATHGIKTRHDSPTLSPRIRPGDLMPRSAIAAPSETLGRLFAVAMHSADFWHDSAALAHTADRHFSRETTTFENRFLTKRFPIYYVELRAKSC